MVHKAHFWCHDLFKEKKRQSEEEDEEPEQKGEDQAAEKEPEPKVEEGAGNSTNQSQDSNLLQEGWLRIAVMTPGVEQYFPPIQQPGNQTKDVEIKFINKEDEKKLDQLPQFGKQRKNDLYGQDAEIKTPDAFYFRINKNHGMHYTETKMDTVILGHMALTKFEPQATEWDSCFAVRGDGNEYWILCSVDGSCPEAWLKALYTIFDTPFPGCPPREGNFQAQKKKVKKELELQPMLITPQPSPDCRFDFDYKFSGRDWQCNCNEGFYQSPIQLPHQDASDFIERPHAFTFPDVEPENIDVVYERGAIRLKSINEAYFGIIQNPTQSQIYKSQEIVIRTPSEHQIKDRNSDFEVQVLFKTEVGNYKNQAAISIPFTRAPGHIIPVFENFDLMNIPDPNTNKGENVIKRKLNVLAFIYDEPSYVENNAPFEYFHYMGSETQPPCAEHVEWFVISEKRQLSSTVITLFKDALMDPTNNSLDQINYGNNRVLQKSNNSLDQINYGNNRVLQKSNNRTIEYYKIKQEEQQTLIIRQQTKLQQLAGHYEKVRVKEPFYQYVDNESSSNGEMVSDRELLDMGIDPKYPDGRQLSRKEQKQMIKDLEKKNNYFS